MRKFIRSISMCEALSVWIHTPGIQVPALCPEVRRFFLHWASWIPRDILCSERLVVTSAEDSL